MSETVKTLEHVDSYLKVGQDYEASDLHLAVNSQPHWRRHGHLTPIWEDAESLTAADTDRLVRSFHVSRPCLQQPTASCARSPGGT